MARQRMLHPGFFTDADLAECSPLARILFEGLWVEADREGRLEDDPRELKVKLLPYDSCSVTPLIDELERIDAVRRYEADGRRLLWLPKFSKYQHPHQREAASVLPPPPAEPRKGTAKPLPSPEKAMPSRAESVTVTESVTESESVLAGEQPPAEKKPKKPPKDEKPPDPRLHPLRVKLGEVYREVTGAEYPFDFGYELKVLQKLLARCPTGHSPDLWPLALAAAWARALRATFPECKSLDKLLEQLPRHLAPSTKAGPDPNEDIIRGGAGACAVCGATDTAAAGNIVACYARHLKPALAEADRVAPDTPWVVDLTQWAASQRSGLEAM